MKRRLRDSVIFCGASLLAFAAMIAHGYGAPSLQGPRTEAVDQKRYGRVVYVSAATGSDDSSDGCQAKPWQTIQHALAQIHDASATNRVAVLVAGGTHGGQTIRMKEYVDMFGGFGPIESHRDILEHATILDGESERRILIGADHSRLDGFIVRRGLVRGRGAAMLCDGVSPTITNNRFVDNRTLAPADWHPRHLHELANDGGAIACLHGAAAVISRNTFADNETEIGRGAAIALDDHCGGQIGHNAFLYNSAGTGDEHRSSDGGAISVFDWSTPRIADNVFVGNRALNRNDGGGIFVALWSSAVITSNVFVGNRSYDDGGALFVGGQEHRYDRPKDQVPGQDKFCVEITENVFFGNENLPGRNSGSMRVAMQARVKLENNVLAENSSLNVQASDVQVTNNTIMAGAIFREFTEQAAPRVVANNILWGALEYLSETPLTYSVTRDPFPGDGNISADPRLQQDGETLAVTASVYKPIEHVTEVQVNGANYEDDQLAGRVVKRDDRWGVVKSNRTTLVLVWGDVSGEGQLKLMPTFQLQLDSPCIDRGTSESAPKYDIDGDPRPSGAGVDIGADEVTQP